MLKIVVAAATALDSKRRSGAASKLIDGKHPIMPGMFYRYGSIIDAVDKRIKQLLFDVDDPLARGAERKLVGSVLDLSRAEEPETAALLVRELRVSSFNDALLSAKKFAELAKEPVRGRSVGTRA